MKGLVGIWDRLERHDKGELWYGEQEMGMNDTGMLARVRATEQWVRQRNAQQTQHKRWRIR